MPVDPNIKILLVEDAATMRQMEKKVLGSLNYSNILEAVDGTEAIQKLQQNNDVGLIISDWNMPNMNGYDLLVWVRTTHSQPQIPFLMATGRGEKKEAQKAKEAGVSSFISKPFNAAELQTKIEEALGMIAHDKNEKTTRPKAEVTSDGKVKIKMGHIQITDHLVLGVLKHLINIGEFKPKHFELSTECMSSWNPVSEALEKGTVQGACVLAPIAMDLFSYDIPLKMILYAHRNGSTAVRKRLPKGGSIDEIRNFFRGKSFYIPHTMSIHHILGHMFFKGIGLEPGFTGTPGVDVEFEVAPPVKMPDFLGENPKASGYLVAEPLGTKAIAGGIADLLFLSSDLWDDHPCCILTLQDEIIQEHPEAVHELTSMFVKAGKFIEQKPGMAAQIGVDFLDPMKTLGLKVPLLKNVLTEPRGIRTDNLYPIKADLDRIQQYMHHEMHVGNLIDIDSFVDMQFAEKAIESKSKLVRSQFDPKNIKKIKDIVEGTHVSEVESAGKALLNLEGKYLAFMLAGQQYQIDILKVSEIIRLVPITKVPNAGSHVKGVINLRGKVIPVVDVANILNLPRKDYTSETRIIVLEIEMGSASEKIGILVDSVHEVSDITAAKIEEPPAMFQGEKFDYILAVSKENNQNRLLLNITKLLMRPLQHSLV
ncbi:MAG: chemotaxis protein CheW [Ignavibacteria bacterium]|nr:chemotaxis protein CheW [Ignavibacteria bacterium]